MRYLEWSYDPVPGDSRYATDYVFVLREGDSAPRVVHERHEMGLFALQDWLRWLGEAGFAPRVVVDPFERRVFVARRPEMP
jgi:hypothetical protein